MKSIKDAIKKFYSQSIVEEYEEKNWLERNIVPIRLAGIILLLLFYCYEIARWYNTDMRDLNTISEKKSQIGKEFQRRETLVLNLTNTVNNYAMHERILFQHVSDMRAQLQSIEALQGMPSASQSAKIEQAFSKLVALVEQYPDLKAEQRFHDLMDMAEISENRIAECMDEYIERIKEFNTCNQRYWCNYFTYPPAMFIPLPAWWEYYHTEHESAPVVPREDFQGKETLLSSLHGEPGHYAQ